MSEQQAAKALFNKPELEASGPIGRLRDAGVNVDKDLTGIWYSPSDESYFVSIGDWVEDGLAVQAKIRAALGENTRMEGEADPQITGEADRFTVRVKAANYHAHAGETIAGNLKRGGDGKFTSAGSSIEQEAADIVRRNRAERGSSGKDGKKRRASRATGRATQRRAEAEQRRQTREEEKKKRVLDQQARAAIRQAERARKKTAIEERRAAREAERKRRNAARMAEQIRRQTERAAKPAKGGGGRGGKGKKPAAPKASVLTPELIEAARALRDGDDLTEAQQQALIRTGLARRTRTSFHLTGAGLRAASQATTKSVPMVFKDHAGRWRWISVSSTAYRDRDGQIVSTKALEDDCVRADATGMYGPLRLWHVPGLDIGDCDFNVVIGRSLIESGTFRDDRIGQRLAQKAANAQLSIGFVHPHSEPDPSGVFWSIHRFERSVIPGNRASNLFTRLIVHKETQMLTPEKEQQLRELVGDDILTSLLAQVTQTEKAAEASGVTFKAAADAMPPATVDDPEDLADGSADEATEDVAESYFTPEELQEIAGAVAPVVAQQVADALAPLLAIPDKLSAHVNDLKGLMGGQQATKDAAIAEVKETQATTKAALEQQIATLKAQADEQIAALQTRLKTLEGEGTRGFRASEHGPDPATVLKGFDAPQPDPSLAPYSFFGELAGTPQA